MAVYAYRRIALLEQQDPGQGPSEAAVEHEQHDIELYAGRHGWPAPLLWQDIDADWLESFADRLEPGGARCPDPGDVLIVARLERIFSACQDAVDSIERLRRLGVALHVLELEGEVTGENFRSDFLQLLRRFAEIEKRRSVERIKHIKHKQRSQGRYLGGSRPFGYMIHENGRLIEHPVEQRVLRRILRLRRQGKSLRAIAREVSTPMAPISFKTVQRVLQRDV